MIHFSLSCENGHEFEGWFRDSADFEKQVEEKLLACPFCDSVKIEKALMSPAVSTSRGKQKKRSANSAKDSSETITDSISPPPGMSKEEIRKVMKDLKKKVTANADNVGTRFAEEARKMHYGEKEKKGIYGKATAKEAQKLSEEGIDFFAMPKLPEDHN